MREKHSQLKLSLDYLLYNEAEGHAYLRHCCAKGFSKQRQLVWPFLACHGEEMAQYRLFSVFVLACYLSTVEQMSCTSAMWRTWADCTTQ